MLRKATRFKADSVGENGIFEGYGSVFGVVDSYGDIVMPGAFAASLAQHSANGSRPKGLWQHDPNHPIITWLELSEDDYGLRCKGRLLLDVEKAREAYALMKAGEIDAMSIGYETAKEEFVGQDEIGRRLGAKYQTPGMFSVRPDNRYRLLHACDLWEVSIVTFPACHPATIDTVKHAPPAVSVAITGAAALAAALACRNRLLGSLQTKLEPMTAIAGAAGIVLLLDAAQATYNWWNEQTQTQIAAARLRKLEQLVTQIEALDTQMKALQEALESNQSRASQLAAEVAPLAAEAGVNF